MALPELRVPVPSEVLVLQVVGGAAVEGDRARRRARGARDGVGEGDRGPEFDGLGDEVRLEVVDACPRLPPGPRRWSAAGEVGPRAAVDGLDVGGAHRAASRC